MSDKLYQRKEPVISSVHTKVKGIAEVREEIMQDGMKKSVHSVFDTADYTFLLQVSTCSFLQDLSPVTVTKASPHSPESRTRKTLAPFKKLCKIPTEKT